MLVDSNQDAGSLSLKSLSWSDAAAGNIVVHAMADGEWGGVQFKVSNATKLPNGDAVLLLPLGRAQPGPRPFDLHLQGDLPLPAAKRRRGPPRCARGRLRQLRLWCGGGAAGGDLELELEQCQLVARLPVRVLLPPLRRLLLADPREDLQAPPSLVGVSMSLDVPCLQVLPWHLY